MPDYSWSETAGNYCELGVIIQHFKSALCGRLRYKTHMTAAKLHLIKTFVCRVFARSFWSHAAENLFVFSYILFSRIFCFRVWVFLPINVGLFHSSKKFTDFTVKICCDCSIILYPAENVKIFHMQLLWGKTHQQFLLRSKQTELLILLLLNAALVSFFMCSYAQHELWQRLNQVSWEKVWFMMMLMMKLCTQDSVNWHHWSASDPNLLAGF